MVEEEDVAEGEGGRVLAINAPHKKSSPSLMGSTLLEGTRRAFARGKKEGEKVRRGGVGAREQRQEDEQKARAREREKASGGGGGAREGETEKRARGCSWLDQPAARRH